MCLVHLMLFSQVIHIAINFKFEEIHFAFIHFLTNRILSDMNKEGTISWFFSLKKQHLFGFLSIIFFIIKEKLYVDLKLLPSFK